MARAAAKIDPVQHPNGIEREYAAALKMKAVQPLKRAADKHVLSVLEAMKDEINRRADSVHDPRYHRDSLESNLRRLSKAFKSLRVDYAGSISREDMKSLAREYGGNVEAYNDGRLTSEFGQVLGIDPTWNRREIERRLNEFAAENLNLITKMGPEVTQKLRDDLIEGFKKGQRWEELRSAARKKLGVGDYRAELIARDQVGKLHGDLTKMRNEQLGVDRYEWITMSDERVRDTHRVNNGEVFEWSDPPARTGHPGNDIQCRCMARSIVDDVVESKGRQGPGGDADHKVPDPESFDASDLSDADLRETKQRMANIVSKIQRAEPDTFSDADLSRAHSILSQASHEIRSRTSERFSLSTLNKETVEEKLVDDEEFEKFREWANDLDPARKQVLIEKADWIQKNTDIPTKASVNLGDIKLEIEPDFEQKDQFLKETADEFLNENDQRGIYRRIRSRIEADDYKHARPFEIGNDLEPDDVPRFSSYREARALDGELRDDRTKLFRSEIVEEYMEIRKNQIRREAADDGATGFVQRLRRAEGEVDDKIDGEVVTFEDVNRIVEERKRELFDEIGDPTIDDDVPMKEVVEQMPDQDWETFRDRWKNEPDWAREHAWKEIREEQGFGGVDVDASDFEDLHEELTAGDGEYPWPHEIYPDSMDHPDDVTDAVDSFGDAVENNDLIPVDYDDAGDFRTMNVEQSRKRAFHNFKKNMINVGSKEGEDLKNIVWHEFGHSLEKMNDRIGDAAKRFLAEKTDGETAKIIRIHDDKPNEWGWDDEFLDRYVGRFYRESGAPVKGTMGRDLVEDLRATEIVSMGMERMRTPEDMAEFYREDPDHFSFMVSVLKGDFGFRKSEDELDVLKESDFAL